MKQYNLTVWNTAETNTHDERLTSGSSRCRRQNFNQRTEFHIAVLGRSGNFKRVPNVHQDFFHNFQTERS